MAKDFTITYKATATHDDITELEDALEEIGPGPVERDAATDTFAATLDWTNDAKGLGNLKGRLNTKANNIVTKVTSP